MNVAPVFDKSLMGSSQSKVKADYWDQVLQLYETQKYKEAILGILYYVDSDLIESTGNATKTEFVIPHGSVVVGVKIEGNHLLVRAPFLSTANARKIPLLRQVAQINFSPMNLSRIVLEEEELAFVYSCPLALCEPYKIYEVFREICFYADHYDDEFIQKFNAEWLQEPKVHPFSASERELAWNHMQTYVEEAFTYIEYFENKRSFMHAWEILLFSLLKIEYYCSPQGVFRSELQKTVELIQEETPVIERLARGKDLLRRFQRYNRADFEADLYRTQTFIPIKFRSTLENIRSNFEESYQQAKAERDSNDHLGATLTMSGVFLRLFYYNNVDDVIAKPIEEALLKASGKKWHDASDALWEGMKYIMKNEQISHTPRIRKLWGFLFGKKQ
jgi:hypothetical protein